MKPKVLVIHYYIFSIFKRRAERVGNSIPSSIFLVTRLSVFLKFSIYSLLENILDESSVTNPYWPLLLYKNNIYRIGPIYKSPEASLFFCQSAAVTHSLLTFLISELNEIFFSLKTNHKSSIR